MTTRAVEQLDEWESSPFRDGYRGLHELADREFSGVIEAGVAKLCMLNGTVVGVLDGDIDDFGDASGTAYEALSPALPLLALMQERNDEVRAKYYSEDTPLSEVDGTLADGGFTGYIELSENVLSGDYYVVYHQGRSMAVAWVGNSGQLLTDDEAFDRADDEVGIFQVRPAELEPVEIPEVGGSDTGATDEAGADEMSESAGAAAGAAAADSGTDARDADGGSVDADDAGAVDDAAGADAGGADDSAPAVDAGASEPGSVAVGDASDPAVTDEGSAASRADRTDDAAGDDRSAESAGGQPGQRDPDASEPAAGSGGEPTDSSADARDRDEHGQRDRADTARTENTSRRDWEDTTRTDRGDTARRDRDESARAGRSDSTRRESAESTRDPAASERSRRDRDPDSSGRRDGDADRTAGTGTTGRTDRSGQTERTDRRESRETDARGADATRETGQEPATDTAGATAGANGRTDAAASGRDTTSPSGAAGTPDQLTTHTIPSLDPSRTTNAAAENEPPAPAGDSADPEPTEAAAAPAAEERTDPPRTHRDAGSERDRTERPAEQPTDSAEARTDSGAERAADPDRAAAGESGGRVADLEAELAERDAEIRELEADLSAAESDREDLRAQLEDVRAERDDLRSQIDGLESERDDLRAERDRLQSEVADLEAEVEHLESQLDDIEAEFGAAVDAERRLGPGEALDQTNLFVRYESKGQATLESAHAGEATREEVSKNLGLEYHTQFEHENVSVGGRPFDEFLRETMQYRFVTWVINDLLYEIQDTGKVAELQDLYDAIPKIDRAELNGAVATEYVEEGQERRSQESFDVVMRDRMGKALLTANMNDSRQAASESMMSSLVTASSHVGESTETLGASFLVTSSFFEPEALETAAEATSGGLLSRDKRASFVKLSRKQGYHLCLVEAREDKFHLAVPEL